PAPGYPPPPATYQPPQGGAYPPPPPAGPVHRSGFLALPFLGLNSFQGKAGDNIGLGLRLGTLLGGRLNEMVSLNGEFTIDVVNPENVPSGVDLNVVEVVFAFSPLVHVPAGTVELVVGPKLGFWGGSATESAGGMTDKASFSGFVLGLNAGLFGALGSSMSVGGLISFDVRTIRRSCMTPSGFAEQCTTDNTGDADKVLGVNAALLF
ncbi:MAG: hypothetical protein ABJA82_09080, partial [Myxococcales bacterium]